jgi:hypothetical protein
MTILKDRESPRRSARNLLQGHLPIFDGSLNTLAVERAKRKVYIHIRNTRCFGLAVPGARLLEEMQIQVAKDGGTIEL